MKLKDGLLRGIYAYGFEKPTKIQATAIAPIMSGRDTIAQAQSGTGKTATFSIATLQSIDASLRACQALILSPTRELAEQSQRVLQTLGTYLKINSHMCVGGRQVSRDRQVLRAGVHVVVGTPGRVTQMIEEGDLKLNHLKLFILDEAHEMLSRGFVEQIYAIFRYLPQQVQIALISATLPDEVLRLSNKFMRDPVRILLKNEEVPLDRIRQYYVQMEREADKLECLCDFYENLSITQAMIFCNSRRRVDWLRDRLTERDHTVATIHGEMTQAERQLVMREFRAGSSRVLVSTDLLACGIDVQQVSLVVNYELSEVPENYIHRIGRTGRGSKKGVAISLLDRYDEAIMRQIQYCYRTHVQELPQDLTNLDR